MSASAQRHEEHEEVRESALQLEVVSDELVAAESAEPSGVRRAHGPRPLPAVYEANGAHREQWNVLAEKIVAYPPAHRRIFLELGDAVPRSYGEAWLEVERARLRARATTLLADDPRRPATIETAACQTPARQARTAARQTQTAAGRTAAYASGPRSRSHPQPARPDQLAHRRHREQAAATRPSPAVAALREPRGLRRLLPGVATLAVLVGAWFAASALSGLHQPAVKRLPGAVPTAHGYLYVARPGDTLWSIASAVEPGADPRILVGSLEQQLKGRQLVAGDRLILP